MTTAINNTLRSLGITGRYKGMGYSAHAVHLVLADESCLQAVTVRLYKATAEHFGCSQDSVERNIRTVIELVWKTSPDKLRNIAGYDLTLSPSVSGFIEIIANYIHRTYEL